MILNGREIADYIEERHRRTVRGMQVPPKLVIVQASADPASEVFIRAKQKYGADIGAVVEVRRQAEIRCQMSDVRCLVKVIKQANDEASVAGIIVQLPLPDRSQEDEVIKAIDPEKDVDGLTPDSPFAAPTPTGIMWLLGSSGIPVKDQTVVILGHGRLVGQPLAKMMRASGAKVITLDENVKGGTLHADIVVSATGEEHLIKPGMVKDGAVVIDCGREVHPDLLANPNLKVTPPVGGVGPMTVAALFENLLLASI